MSGRKSDSIWQYFETKRVAGKVGGHVHTAEYLLEVATSAVISTEQRYGCKVGTFVTDNASNMVKMRREVASDRHTTDTSIISYGCSAHYLIF